MTRNRRPTPTRPSRFSWRTGAGPACRSIIRTGKRLPKRVTEIAIQFNPAPLHIFDSDGAESSAPNLLIVRIQPEEGISLKFLSKRPGSGMTLRPVSMDFNYGSSFGERSPSAYETLLLDAIIGDATLYTRQDMVEASWAVVEPIQNVVARNQVRFSQLCRRNLGTGGGRRHAGAARPRVEETLMMRRHHRARKNPARNWRICGYRRQTEQAEGGTGVLRACSMTLVVLAEEREDAQAIGETLAALMPEHPGRAIVMRLRGEGERSLAERVFAQCWMPFGQRRQICCEQMEITASDASLPDLPPVVLPLAVPDLPVIVWCRSPRLFEMPAFAQLAAMAQKVVVDSAGARDPARHSARRTKTGANGTLLGDLAWTRLTRWREMLAQVFENQQNAAQLTRVSRAAVEWGGSRFSAGLYLAAWVGASLARIGVNSGYELQHVSEEDVLHLRLTGEGFALELAREGDRMVVTLNGVSQCTNLPQPTDYLLMREELGIVRHDPVFEKLLASLTQEDEK